MVVVARKTARTTFASTKADDQITLGNASLVIDDRLNLPIVFSAGLAGFGPRCRMEGLLRRILNRSAVTLHNRMARGCLASCEATAEFVNIVVCLGKKGLSGLSHFGHDRIVPWLINRNTVVVSHCLHLMLVSM